MSTVSAVASRSRSPAANAALIVAAVGVAAILGAYFFQYVIGLAPCPLCLEQRIPYYVGIPLALVVALAALRGAPPRLVTGGLALLCLVMLVGTALAVYHSGVEWKFWPGPQDCSGPINKFGRAGSILDGLNKGKIVRCDEASRFLGVSLANCNIVVSAALAIVAGWGVTARRA